MRAVSGALFLACTGLSLAQAPIRWLDLEGDTSRQVTVRQVGGKYLGHPTTVLLPDGRTILCVHPEGHGRGPIVLQRSRDGGRNWSKPLPVPSSWATSKETPTIHRLLDPNDGSARLVVFSGLFPIRSSISADDGNTWSELAPIGPAAAPFGGIVAMSAVVPLQDGDYAAYFHDDGRFFAEDGKRANPVVFTVYETRSSDGGRTWRAPSVIWTGSDVHLCEPGVVRSPDGKQLAMLLRENSRRKEAHVMFSEDDGANWTAPIELPRSLTGDRHVGRYAPDGRLLVSFRDMAKGSPTRGDWVAWVGTFDDIVKGREGQYRVRLSRNWRSTDCAYPGVELRPDGAFVLTTYGHWQPGARPFIRSVRLRLAELDELAQGPVPMLTREPGTVHATPRTAEWWQKRVAADLKLAEAGGFELVMLGDSITQSWRAGGRQIWEEKWAPRNAINLGASGDRTQHVLWRLDHGLMQALASPANDVRCVVVMIGTNNSNGRDCTAEEIAFGIEAVVQRVRRGLPRAHVLLLDIFPRGEKPGPQRAKNQRASRLAKAAFVGDEMVTALDIGKAFVGEGGRIEKAIMPDFLHLTPEGYRRWAEAIESDVEARMAR
ncbi:MAG: GDSL-type esterase/lipase family protein [Planctomycetota bacterium]